MTASIDKTMEEAKKLSLSDKWKLIRALISDVGQDRSAALVSIIQRTPGVAGGRPCVANTRIPVTRVVYYLNQGVSSAEILETLPSLRMMDLEAVKQYYEKHKDEIDAEIAEEE